MNKQKERIKELKNTQTELVNQLNELKSNKNKKEMKQQEVDLKLDDIAQESIIRVTLDLNNENDFNLVKLTRQQFKDTKLSKDHLEHIVYVDIEKKSNKIYIRCKSSDTAKILMNSSDFLADLPNKIILMGHDEQEYLNRIMYGRNKYKIKKDKKLTAEKCNMQVEAQASKQHLQKIDDKSTPSKHIKFEDDNDD